MRAGKFAYANSGAAGVSGLKAPFRVADGGLVELKKACCSTITTSGTCLVSSTAVDASTTGIVKMDECDITMTCQGTIVAGLAYLNGTGITHHFAYNTMEIDATGATSAYGFFSADTASTTSLSFNHLHVTGATNNYGYINGTGAILTSHFNDIVAANGVISSGTLNEVDSLSDGSLTISSTLIVSDITYPTADGAVGTVVVTDGTGTLSLAVVGVPGGGTGATTFTNHGILIGSGVGALAATAELSDGQLLIGSTGNDAVLGTLTGGVGVTVANAAGSITINATGGGFEWTRVAGVAQALAVQNGYIPTNVALTTFTLPVTAALGSVFKIDGEGTGLAVISQNATQQIHYGPFSTTAGVGGSLSSSHRRDCITLRCTVADTEFIAESAFGNWGAT